jgi:sulfur dioxygenase
MKKPSLTNMTCEQVYNIWATEPELIKIFDLRPINDFQKIHIPGAVSVLISEIEYQISKLHGKLGVIITSPDDEPPVKSQLSHFSDIVFLSECERWQSLNHPSSGHSIQQILKNIKQDSQGGGKVADIIFHQLFESESSTYTYIIADAESKEAAIIDPVLETVNRDLQLIQELNLRLLYILDTHVHADHITGAGELRTKSGAKTGISALAGVECADISLEDGQELMLGKKKITVIATPGHTNTCLSFYFEGIVFTGDTLLIRGTGRTDFQEGSSEKLFSSVTEKLFILPDQTKVYPGHDYKGFTSSTIGLEKAFNPRLGNSRSKEDFTKIMNELKLANPKKIHEAVPANLNCGKTKEVRLFHPQTVDGIPLVSSTDVLEKVGKVKIIDVRRSDEFNNELGHIRTAQLVTLGADLTKFLEQGDRSEEIVFVCRSGGRSGQATQESIRLGYRNTVNMVGGMLAWNEKALPKENK